MRIKSRSSRKSNSPGLFLIFLIMGSMFEFKTVRGFIDSVDMNKWEKVPCTIITSEAKQNRSYYFQVVYNYTYNNRTYTGSRYTNNIFRSKNIMAVSQLAEKYPVGSVFDCFVNPKSPDSAVLVLPNPLKELPNILFPLIFIAVGGFGLFSSLMKNKRNNVTNSFQNDSKETRTQFEVSLESDINKTIATDGFVQEYASGEPIEFKATNTPSNLFALLIFTAIWNGVVFYFVREAIIGKSDFIMLILLPFVLIGLLLILSCVRVFMQLFNPKLNLTLSSGTLMSGTKASVSWEIVGNGQKVKDLFFSITCIEMNKRPNGQKNTVTKGKVLYSQSIAEIESPGDIGSGSFTFTIPTDALTTVEHDDYERTWYLKAQGSIRLWPDITEKHEFTVLSRSGSEMN